MLLFILLPLLILLSAVGVFSEDPDRVASNYSPYVEIGR
jgi:hypothetical protein